MRSLYWTGSERLFTQMLSTVQKYWCFDARKCLAFKSSTVVSRHLRPWAPKTLRKTTPTTPKGLFCYSIEHHSVWLFRIWIEKKQRAYQAWLSYVLSPNSNAASSLNSKRLFAKVRGCVAKVYHKDPSVSAAMLKVEASISNGRLRLLTDVQSLFKSEKLMCDA